MQAGFNKSIALTDSFVADSWSVFGFIQGILLIKISCRFVLPKPDCCTLYALPITVGMLKQTKTGFITPQIHSVCSWGNKPTNCLLIVVSAY